ncbi:MAG: helix-turn-helix transcriptional regulator [Anaerolineae bacterium]|nr:helix-turn-helix transcriptional regulator [Anaerolineae bacterium]
MESVLLLLLHEGLSHGYALLEQLGEYGLSQIDPSAVYRALRDMEEHGLVDSSWDEQETQGPPRRVYRLTALGNETLAFWIADLQETQKRIENVLERYRQHMQQEQGKHHQEWMLENIKSTQHSTEQMEEHT